MFCFLRYNQVELLLRRKKTLAMNRKEMRIVKPVGVIIAVIIPMNRLVSAQNVTVIPIPSKFLGVWVHFSIFNCAF